MRLAELARRARGSVVAPPGGDADVDIDGVAHHTADVGPGQLFCCVRGRQVDGHDLAGDAVRAGAAALMVERPLGLGVPELHVPDVRAALGPVAAACAGDPSRHIPVIGVTGTSGKTTTTHLVAAVLEAAGRPSAVIGTLSGQRTTPEAPELQQLLARHRDEDRRAVAMEVSSHALAMGRVRGTWFAVAVFTNLSHDHLDFHGDLERYFEAKATLFSPEYTDTAVVNLDDPRGAELARRGAVATVGYSRSDATDVVVQADRCRFRWRGHTVALGLGGAFNVDNALAAATTASELGVDDAAVAEGLSGAPPVPGRFEPVDEGQPFAVVVDYSHKPAALELALRTARAAAEAGRVLVVFGAGGDRDPTKRPAMGEVAARLADRVLLTTDNPRGEDPLAIIDAVRAGMGTERALTVEPDRRAAIDLAVAEARPGDVVLIAGKGHETHQILADRTVPFDDREVARWALRRRRESSGW